MYYTYVLKSKKDEELYVGFCEDLKKDFKNIIKDWLKQQKTEGR